MNRHRKVILLLVSFCLVSGPQASAPIQEDRFVALPRAAGPNRANAPASAFVARMQKGFYEN